MNPLTKTLFSTVLYGLWSVVDQPDRSQRLPRLIFGMLLCWLAASVGLLAMLIILAAIFTQLASLENLAWPLLVTGVIAGGVAVIIGIEGWRQMLKK